MTPSVPRFPSGVPYGGRCSCGIGLACRQTRGPKVEQYWCKACDKKLMKTMSPQEQEEAKHPGTCTRVGCWKTARTGWPKRVWEEQLCEACTLPPVGATRGRAEDAAPELATAMGMARKELLGIGGGHVGEADLGDWHRVLPAEVLPDRPLSQAVCGPNTEKYSPDMLRTRYGKGYDILVQSSTDATSFGVVSSRWVRPTWSEDVHCSGHR